MLRGGDWCRGGEAAAGVDGLGLVGNSADLRHRTDVNLLDDRFPLLVAGLVVGRALFHLWSPC